MIFHPLERTRNGNDPRAETRSAPESVGLSADKNLPPIKLGSVSAEHPRQLIGTSGGKKDVPACARVEPAAPREPDTSLNASEQAHQPVSLDTVASMVFARSARNAS